MTRPSLLTAALSGLALTLAACGQPSTPGPAATAWTTAELEARGVLDLSELGALTYTPDREARLDGRPVPAEILGAYPYTFGTTYVNVLRLDESAINALPPEVAGRLMTATPAQVRDFMEKYSISLDQLRAARVDGTVNTRELTAVLGAAGERGALVADLRRLSDGVTAEKFITTLEEVNP